MWAHGHVFRVLLGLNSLRSRVENAFILSDYPDRSARSSVAKKPRQYNLLDKKYTSTSIDLIKYNDAALLFTTMVSWHFNIPVCCKFKFIICVV
jgi:hypothetical protein